MQLYYLPRPCWFRNFTPSCWRFLTPDMNILYIYTYRKYNVTFSTYSSIQTIDDIVFHGYGVWRVLFGLIVSVGYRCGRLVQCSIERPEFEGASAVTGHKVQAWLCRCVCHMRVMLVSGCKTWELRGHRPRRTHPHRGKQHSSGDRGGVVGVLHSGGSKRW